MIKHTNPKSTEVYYSIREISRMLNLSTKRTYQLVALGKLCALRISDRCIRVSGTDLQDFLQQSRRELADSYFLPPPEKQ